MNKQRIWSEISAGTRLFKSRIMPPRELRIPITLWSFPYTLTYIPPLIFMAYLARRPGTELWLARLLLLPLVVMFALESAFRYMWVDEAMNVYNWGQGLLTLCMIAKALDYAFSPDGVLKTGERISGQITETVLAPSLSGQQNGSSSTQSEQDPLRETSESESESSPPSKPALLPKHASQPPSNWFVTSFELLSTQRGLGWEFGSLVYVPPRPPSYYSRRNFLLSNTRALLVHFTLLDFFESLLKLVPGVGSPRGGTIFLASWFLPSVPGVPERAVRYALSTFISLLSGSAVLAGFTACYSLISLIGVGLLHQDPRAWPPVFDAPFRSTSLNEFWAKRWHQLLRRTFLIFGGLPAASLFSLLPLPLSAPTRKSLTQLATVLGAFFASGLYHEFASIAMGRAWDGRVVWFFVAHGALVVFERVWRRVSGRRVGGWGGRLWVYFWVIGVGQICVDAWHMKGLAGGLVVPPMLSPTRRVIFPFVELLTGWRLETLHY